MGQKNKTGHGIQTTNKCTKLGLPQIQVGCFLTYHHERKEYWIEILRDTYKYNIQNNSFVICQKMSVPYFETFEILYIYKATYIFPMNGKTTRLHSHPFLLLKPHIPSTPTTQETINTINLNTWNIRHKILGCIFKGKKCVLQSRK